MLLVAPYGQFLKLVHLMPSMIEPSVFSTFQDCPHMEFELCAVDADYLAGGFETKFTVVTRDNDCFAVAPQGSTPAYPTLGSTRKYRRNQSYYTSGQRQFCTFLHQFLYAGVVSPSVTTPTRLVKCHRY